MACIISAKFNMKFDILREVVVTDDGPQVIDEPNEWVLQQDPDSGEIIRNYAPVPDNPTTPEINESVLSGPFWCMARGIISDGIRVTGTSQRFTEIYENVDYVKINFPADVILTKGDKVTNIRDRDDNIIWKNEEEPGAPATVFHVMGVTPMPDPFGRVVEQTALLQRADNQ